MRLGIHNKVVEVEPDLDGFIFIFLAVQCTSKEVACNRPKCGLRGWRNKKTPCERYVFARCLGFFTQSRFCFLA